MPKFEVDKRLVGSPICPEEDASKYTNELRELANENRIRMIKLLMLREMCVCELMVALSLT
ncbi:ArsR family transcriptional regulator [Candidatus Bathyarchaeota archaeon]|nr:ArsR family transcriptional regulator [Candidatus Bathyarchaeota archaeon]